MKKRIVETDNFGRDFPKERFLNIPPVDEDVAEKICNLINNSTSETFPRYWKVVPLDYRLEPGFEP